MDEHRRSRSACTSMIPLDLSNLSVDSHTAFRQSALSFLVLDGPGVSTAKDKLYPCLTTLIVVNDNYLRFPLLRSAFQPYI